VLDLPVPEFAVPDDDEADGFLLDAPSSAWAIPAPPASAALMPSVSAPAPSHEYGSMRRPRLARCIPVPVVLTVDRDVDE
jgi:hypothetical protein